MTTIIITAQEAIFMLSNINKQIDTKTRSLHANLFGPITVNGKSVVPTGRLHDTNTVLRDFDLLRNDAASLKEVISNYNATQTIDGKSIAYHLEWLRHNRGLLQDLENIVASKVVRAESGVGVVEYNAYNEAKLVETISELQTRINGLSSAIDHTNATSYVTVALIGEYH